MVFISVHTVYNNIQTVYINKVMLYSMHTVVPMVGATIYRHADSSLLIINQLPNGLFYGVKHCMHTLS
jgi:hypothetical protein